MQMRSQRGGGGEEVGEEEEEEEIRIEETADDGGSPDSTRDLCYHGRGYSNSNSNRYWLYRYFPVVPPPWNTHNPVPSPSNGQ
ncbi:hypothetical protein HJFPF1_06978 [Paramyrothecium foliicola]|nr:hypothetical protein HJFPF1_06978 [Paramyrothecium foliicola]